jgi:hypothetical protein
LHPAGLAKDTHAMTNAELTKILSALYDGPRPLAELLGTSSDAARVKEVGNYLRTRGLACVSMRNGIVIATITQAGRYYVKKARGAEPGGVP